MQKCEKETGVPTGNRGRIFCEKRTVKNEEVKSDIIVLGFWSTGQVAFLDIRISNPNATRYINKSIMKTCETNEREKKRKHNQRIQGVIMAALPFWYCH